MEAEILPVREIRIGFQDEDDQWIILSIHRRNWWRLRWERGGLEPKDFELAEIPVEAIEMLRDFLNYAVPAQR